MGADVELFSIGVYGKSEVGFFRQLEDSAVDCLVDVRLRRGMRGPQYAFANKSRLQSSLLERHIDYRAEKALAPPAEIRALQKQADEIAQVSKRHRDSLSNRFISEYIAHISSFDFDGFFASLTGRTHIAFFCVEAKWTACHRSILVSEISRRFQLRVTHL